MTSPDLSILIPTYERPDELRTCLEGFAVQTEARARFEIVVVDDGSRAELETVVRRFAPALDIALVRIPHGGISAARNAGIARARARHLALWDDDQRPTPVFVAHCLEFHARHPAAADAALLHFEPAAAFADDPVMRWAFHQMYAFPADPSAHGWLAFWGGAVTCKRSLFADGGFDPAYRFAEDAELAWRVNARVGLRVHFVRRTVGVLTRCVTFAQFYRRRYLASYYRHRLAQAHPGTLAPGYGPWTTPEDYLFRDRAELETLLATADAMERAVRAEPRERGERRYRLLCALWRRASLHAEAAGWLAAREGIAPDFDSPIPGLPAPASVAVGQP
ncbi:MAG: glycosyltransferase [Candidatus Rokubacteria bacterium]|nr:glycosyltransferase [Candidatus Rokubacteria bacterium]